MANCLKCKHFQIYPKDLAILRLSTDQNTMIRYKCGETHPHIRKITIANIKEGACDIYSRL